jgi:NAD(P)-dependent dehydrogenase (short-subunit alcohol dehydrogenase family)
MSELAMNEKICMITGATSGIGKATARALASKGAIVILVGRNLKKCQDTVQWIKAKTSNPYVDYLFADLSSLTQVRNLASSFKQRYEHLNVLINNAGAKYVSRQETVDGYEMTIALNHLSHFLLTYLLIDSLKASSRARIINVSSGSHTSCNGIHFEDLQSHNNYIGKEVYAQSKLANILFTYELARRLEGTGITANALEPGGVLTNICRNDGLVRWGRHIAAHVLAGNLVGPKKGARTSVYLATSPEVEGVSGKFFSRQKVVLSSEASYDLESARRLWQVSLELTGLTRSLV